MARKKHARKRGCLSRLITLALLIVLIGYPFYEARNIKVETKTLLVEGLHADLNGLTIVYLSDIHFGPRFSMAQVQSLVYQINAMHADIILLGGDYADDSDDAIRFFEQAPPFRANLLVAGVLGNHDRTQPESNRDKLQSAMITAGVWPLVNNIKSVKIGDAAIVLAGIDDINNGYPEIQGVASMVSADDFVVFLPHSPGALPQALQAVDKYGRPRWFDLALSGHTHGGQVTFFGRPLIPEFAKVDGRYLTGWIEENRIPILVSNGVGTAYLPVRLFAPPQIHVITLKQK